ncbi:hypothetical protein H131_04609 [Lysinibacillus sphaericus OT4b.31]|uniref:Uncharacterized protein n=1 Tax=Lysinibacillus sphaericus OT4b.31 TaxID=1285586 RepID=R7ZIH6_LYSSH|nr:hypothetical protein H131_04609 [Lysinibacillus sphaericus OT4b.31]
MHVDAIESFFCSSPKVEGDICYNLCPVDKLIGVAAGRLLRDQRLIGRPQESVQSERKSTTSFGDESFFIKNTIYLHEKESVGNI